MIPPWLLIAALQGTVRAEPALDYAHGLDALRAGQLDEAESHLLHALEQGAQDPAIYHALGNTYYRMEAPGRALSAWERGLRLNPRASDLEANLSHARRELNLSLDLPRSKSRLPWNRWIAPWEGTVGSGVLVAFGLAIQVRRRQKASLRTKPWNVVSLASLVLGFLLALSVWEAQSVPAGHIVVGESVVARSALGAQGVALFELTPGTRVALIEESQANALVEIADGQRGWLPVSALLSCDPEDPFSPR